MDHSKVSFSCKGFVRGCPRLSAAFRAILVHVRGCPRHGRFLTFFVVRGCPRRDFGHQTVSLLRPACPRSSAATVESNLLWKSSCPRTLRVFCRIWTFLVCQSNVICAISPRLFCSCSACFCLLPRRSNPAMADSKLVCLHCALEFSAADGRQHGRHFRCKNCESALRQIRRNLDSSDLENFTPEEQRDFFRKLAEEKQSSGNGRVPWSTVRASLLTAMTNRTMSGYRSDVQGKKLPLEVWVSKGWKEETIRRMPSEYSEEYGCDVFQVKVQQETWFEANEKMRERIVQQEQQATKKKGSKAENDLDLPAAAAAGSKKSENKESEDASGCAEEVTSRESSNEYPCSKGCGSAAVKLHIPAPSVHSGREMSRACSSTCPSDCTNSADQTGQLGKRCPCVHEQGRVPEVVAGKGLSCRPYP